MRQLVKEKTNKQTKNSVVSRVNLKEFGDEHQHPVFSVSNHLWVRIWAVILKLGACLQPELMN